MVITAAPAQQSTAKKKKKKLTSEQKARAARQDLAKRAKKREKARQKGGMKIEGESVFTAKGQLIRPVPPRMLKSLTNAGQKASDTTSNPEMVELIAPPQNATLANRAGIGALILKQIAAGSRRDFELWLHARRDSQQSNQKLINRYLKANPHASLQAVPVITAPAVVAPLTVVEAPAKREGGLTQVRTRPDQAAFSATVRENFRSVCAVTGARSVQRCEAAHIVEHKHNGVDHYTNGLWLRSDLHALFDAGFCAIDPAAMTIHFCANVLALDIDLQAFHGRAISQPRRPINAEFLKARWDAFLKQR